MKLIFYSLLIAIFPLLQILNAQEVKAEAKAQWSLQIVPTRSPQKGLPVIDCASIPAGQSGFNVVLTNTSTQKLSVWREWCSWGHETLSFEITLQDSRVAVITKKPREYSKNYPDPFLVSPNKSFVFNVNFNDDEWQGFPKDWKNQNIKIKAVYRVEKDEQSVRLKVWSGEVKSENLSVKLYK